MYGVRASTSGSANGNEIITVNAVDETSIYDINGNASPASQTGDNNKVFLEQSTGVLISSNTTDNATLTVTFNEV